MTPLTFAAIGLALAVLAYTVTLTLSYSSVVRDLAVIRTVVEERTVSHRAELAQLREELARNRVEIATLRMTVEGLRNDLSRQRVIRRHDDTEDSQT